MEINLRDAAAGGIFIAFAALFALGTTDLAIGTAVRMGPGYFPLMLSGVLAAIGAVTIVKAIKKAPTPIGSIPWRGAIVILLAPILFGLMVRGFTFPGGVHLPAFGLAPSVAVVIAVSAFASRLMTFRLALILTVTLTIFCVVVFQKLLGLPLPAFAGPFDFLNPYFDAAYELCAAPLRIAGNAILGAISAIANTIAGLFGAGG